MAEKEHTRVEGFRGQRASLKGVEEASKILSMVPLGSPARVINAACQRLNNRIDENPFFR